MTTDVGNLSDYTSQMKEASDALFVLMVQDLKAADASLKRHHSSLKAQDQSLEKIYDLIATLEHQVHHTEEQSRVDSLWIDSLENENFLLRESHDEMKLQVCAMEERINWLTPRRCRCVDRLDGVLQADSEPSEEGDDEDSDVLTYATDQLYCTPPHTGSEGWFAGPVNCK